MKRFFFLFLIFVLSTGSQAQGWLPMSAESAGSANAIVALPSIWSVHHNPGALGFIEESGFGVSYQSRFLLRDLQSQGITGAIKLKSGVIGLGAQFYGFEQYRTTRVGGGYSLKLAENFSMGVQLNYLNLSLNENYGNRSSLTAEIGMLGKITDNWSVGFAVFNLNRAKLASFQDDRFTTIFRFGTAYNLSSKVNLLLEFFKDIENPLSIRGAVEYQAVDNLFFRLGASSAPMELSFGIGYRMGVFDLSLASNYNQILGFSPAFNLNYFLKND